MAAFTARLPVDACKALGSWQPRRPPDELVCTFTVAGVTCNVGRRGAVLFIRDAQVQPSWGSAGGRRAWRQGLGWEGRTAGRALPGPHTPGAGSRAGVLASSQNQRGVGCRAPPPRPASPFHPFCPRAPGNPAEPGKPPLPLAPFRPNRKPEGKTHKDGRSAQPRARRLPPAREGLQPYLPADDHPRPTPVQALSGRHGGFLFGATASRAGRHSNTCDFSFSIKVYK